MLQVERTVEQRVGAKVLRRQKSKTYSGHRSKFNVAEPKWKSAQIREMEPHQGNALPMPTQLLRQEFPYGAI